MPLFIDFATPTSLLRETDRVSDLPIVGNGPPGTFVLFPNGLRVSLPTDQIIFADDVGGHARVGFGGMQFVGLEEGRLVFVRIRELFPEEQLSPTRSHTMRLDPEWVTAMSIDDRPIWPARTRRPRYSGKNPRAFHEKYKELNPEKYEAEVRKIVDSGKTPAGMHRAVMVAEVLQALAPTAGALAVDCTLGFGGHARALLEQIQPGGRLIGLDLDPIELPRTEARLRAAGFGADTFVARRNNFAGLLQVLADEGLPGADLIVADLGVSSMQLDNPERGFTYKAPGPLDMRMNPTRGQPASQLIARLSEDKIARLLMDHADEPDARTIARALKADAITTTIDLGESVRRGIQAERPKASDADVEKAIRRTFQALRIAVNDEFSALDTFLRHLPACLAPGGRVAVLTFHSGEDRRVKKAFESGLANGSYTAIANEVVRPTAEEVRANPRAGSAKLRWAQA